MGARASHDFRTFIAVSSMLSKRGAGNLTVTSRYGSHKERRMLRCRVCKVRFSERKGTPYFDSRLPPASWNRCLTTSPRGVAFVRPVDFAKWIGAQSAV